jgi:hypothetical protein
MSGTPRLPQDFETRRSVVIERPDEPHMHVTHQITGCALDYSGGVATAETRAKSAYAT